MTSIFALVSSVLTLAGGPVTGVSIAPVAERTQVVIAIDGDVSYRDFTMEGPNRLVLDLFDASHSLPQDNFLGIHRGGVTSVRTSQFSPDVVRIVLELAEPLSYRIETAPGVLRISLENRAGAFEPWTTGPAAAPVSSPVAAAQGPAGAFPMAPPPRAALAQEARRISVTFSNTPVQDVLLTFAEFSGRSIVAGTNVTGLVSATIVNQPWDEALQAILRTNGFFGEENDQGIIEVHNVQDLTSRESGEPLQTVAYKINYATAQEVLAAVQTLLSERGEAAAAVGTNTVVATDIPRVQQQIAAMVRQIDRETPQVTIQAKIIFVSRRDLNEFGITYDLKDSAGNQLNVVTPGVSDLDGDGIIELPAEQVEIGTNVVSLGGNSVAALGNANARVVSPTLTLLTSLLIGRHTLLTFIEALQSSSLSDVQAAPLVRVMDNNAAIIRVGEDTPLRVIDAQAAGGAAGTALPVATVQIQETGISLQVTPHVTDGDNILLDLVAERSAPQLAESDVGFIFTTQEASTRVLVADGQTVVIGGLTVTEMNEVRSGIPLLMDLPVIGRLFRVTRREENERDLIILVTPHIVRNAAE